MILKKILKNFQKREKKRKFSRLYIVKVFSYNIKKGGSMSKCEKQEAVIADEQIVELYWRREENAIRETDKKYGRYLFKVAHNILLDREDSEECKNDAYLEAWNSIPPTRPRTLGSFMTQIVRCIALDRYKAKTTKKRIPSELFVSMEDLSYILADGDFAETEYMAKEVGKMINAYVKGLTEKEQYIFVSRYYVAEKVEDIARELGVSQPTVYRELEHIKNGLREYLEREGVYV
jgi:RNA polymerase sigma-70 factor (ECF subfamily)